MRLRRGARLRRGRARERGAGRRERGLPRVGRGRARPIAHRGEPVAHRENTLPALRGRAGPACGPRRDRRQDDAPTASSCCCTTTRLDRLWELDRDVRELTAAELADLGGPADRPGRASRVPRWRGARADRRVRRGVDASTWTSAEWAEPRWTWSRRPSRPGTLRRDEVVWCGDLDALRAVRAADADARIFLSWGEGRAGPPTTRSSRRWTRRRSTRTGGVMPAAPRAGRGSGGSRCAAGPSTTEDDMRRGAGPRCRRGDQQPDRGAADGDRCPMSA